MNANTGDFEITPLRLRAEAAEREVFRLNMRIAEAAQRAAAVIAERYGAPLVDLADIIRAEVAPPAAEDKS